eukprot:171302-Chlamydomonas_euryale.AAC.1
MFKFGEGCYSHALASGFCGDCRLKMQGFQSHGRFHAPFTDHMAWVFECRICFHQVVAEFLPASRREYICGGCKEVWEHRLSWPTRACGLLRRSAIMVPHTRTCSDISRSIVLVSNTSMKVSVAQAHAQPDWHAGSVHLRFIGRGVQCVVYGPSDSCVTGDVVHICTHWSTSAHVVKPHAVSVEYFTLMRETLS